MYGWRARIGLLVPASNTVAEVEFHRMVPEGVSVHTARVMMGGSVGSTEQRFTEQDVNEALDRAAEAVASTDANIVVWGATTPHMRMVLKKGIDYEDELVKRIESLTKIPVITGGLSEVEALKKLELKKIALVGPQKEQVTKMVKPFIEGKAPGVEVVSVKALQTESIAEITRLEPYVAYILAKEADKPETDGVLITCTALRTIEVIDTLERDVGKPVVTSNQATLWAALRKLGIHDQISGYGKLLREH